MLCGFFTCVNVKRLENSDKDYPAYEKLMKLYDNDLEKCNIITEKNRGYVMNFLCDKNRFHNILCSAKKNKHEYAEEKYDLIRRQIIYSVEKG